MRIELNSSDMNKAVEHYVRTVLLKGTALEGKALEISYISGSSVYVEDIAPEPALVELPEDEGRAAMAPAATD